MHGARLCRLEIALLSLALAAVVGACDRPDTSVIDTARAGRAAITRGAPESGYPAVFSLAYAGQGGCTGTCISPRVGTTATHCVHGDPASSFTALFGADEARPEHVLQVVALAEAPDGADIALVAFDEDCPATIPYNRAPLEDHVGEPVVMVGFGVTTETADDGGLKRSGVATLFSVDPAAVSGLVAGELATSNEPAGTCNGDSGGPTFMRFDGAERMVGTTSRGSLETPDREWPCGQGRSIAVRADSYAAFIDDFVAAHQITADTDAGRDAGASRDASDTREADASVAGDAGRASGDVPAPARASASGCGVAAQSTSSAPSVLLLASLALPFVRRRRPRARGGADTQPP